MRGDLLILALSGPDGGGKSMSAREVTRRLVERGFGVVTVHGYACVLCRAIRPSSHRPGSGSKCGRDRRILQAAFTAHALFEVAELRTKIRIAGLRARRRSGGRPALVLDRGPLDSLLRFQGSVTPRVMDAYRRVLNRVDLTVVLYATPEELARRDGEHSALDLSVLRDRYLAEVAALPRAVAMDTTSQDVGSIGAQLLRDLDDRRPRVVLSIFDDVENPTYGGGGASVVARLASLLAVDHDVTVLTAGRSAGQHQRGPVEYLTLPLLGLGPRSAQLAFHALLPVMAARVPHDLWIDSFTPPCSASLVPLATRAPVVGLAQLLSAESMAAQYHLPFTRLETLGLRMYNDVVVLNPHDLASVQRRASQVRTHLIPVGADLPVVDERNVGRGRYLLYLGRIAVHDKGLDLLLEALGAAEEALPLVIAGTGSRREESRLQSLMSPYTSEKVRRVGHVAGGKKDALLRDAALLIMPSRVESFGLSALEAMSHGKPVLHFDVPALRWIEGDVRIPPFDVDALARAMTSLSWDEDRRVRLGRMALVAAGAHDWARVGPAYVALVRRLLSGRAQSESPRRRSRDRR
jgi:glycosyltransferase involved in cell wall biosynthesis